jgi:hypothetical protein
MGYFHVGIVVPDFATARSRLTELLGTAWGPEIRLDAIDLRDGDGRDLSLPNRICYSTEPPYLELIQEVPGSVWSCNEHSNLHHIGYWEPSLAAGSDRLLGLGCPLHLAGRDRAVAPAMFAYHGTDLGVRIELLDETIRPLLFGA